jgi:hypothetical protein
VEHAAVPQASVEYEQSALEPLQVPAQVPVPVHAVRLARGLSPDAMALHVPWEDATSQASHVPVQALSQQ